MTVKASMVLSGEKKKSKKTRKSKELLFLVFLYLVSHRTSSLRHFLIVFFFPLKHAEYFVQLIASHYSKLKDGSE